MSKPAVLVLENGAVFYGVGIGSEGQTTGEVVFNTAMTGYQEILTDPSYAKQMVTFTYPHIGNVGVNSEDCESDAVWASGLIIRQATRTVSNWRAQTSLHDYLVERKIVGIAEVDTRRLTRMLRDQGAQRGCISTNIEKPSNNKSAEDPQIKKLLEAARAVPSMEGLDLAKEVSTQKNYAWRESTWQWPDGVVSYKDHDFRYHVVAYDFGIKQNILRMLADRKCKLTVVPATTTAEEVIALKPDGVFLSNGPGDPAACTYAIEALKILLDRKIPIFGICLGHQLLALASGAKTFKMKFGHHGSNHPVRDERTQTVLISSQNHGFSVDEASLTAQLEITHRSLFDDSIQGIRRKDCPAFAFQGHPEASPGPHEVSGLFDEFIALMK